MTHEEAFLQAILEAPDDDGPRLVYADYLEERGDPRGEFIRVQCALARHKEAVKKRGDKFPAPSMPEGFLLFSKREAFRRRGRELLERHRGSWTAGMAPGLVIDAWSLDEPMVPYAYGARAKFRRGFVESVECTAAAWLAHADALAAAAPIREVTLTTWPEVFELYGQWHLATRGGLFTRSCRNYRPPPHLVGMLWITYAHDVLAASWPRITFTLPGPEMQLAEWVER